MFLTRALGLKRAQDLKKEVHHFASEINRAELEFEERALETVHRSRKPLKKGIKELADASLQYGRYKLTNRIPRRNKDTRYAKLKSEKVEIHQRDGHFRWF